VLTAPTVLTIWSGFSNNQYWCIGVRVMSGYGMSAFDPSGQKGPRPSQPLGISVKQTGRLVPFLPTENKSIAIGRQEDPVFRTINCFKISH
jgi:hypothetical protein